MKNKNIDSSYPDVGAWIKKKNDAAVQTNRMKNRNRKRFQWPLVAVLFSLFIFSCTYKVEHSEKFGDIINFSIDKQDYQSLLRIGSLQRDFNFDFLQFQRPGEPESVSFISLIKQDEKKVNSLRQQ